MLSGELCGSGDDKYVVRFLLLLSLRSEHSEKSNFVITNFAGPQVCRFIEPFLRILVHLKHESVGFPFSYWQSVTTTSRHTQPIDPAKKKQKRECSSGPGVRMNTRSTGTSLLFILVQSRWDWRSSEYQRLPREIDNRERYSRKCCSNHILSQGVAKGYGRWGE